MLKLGKYHRIILNPGRNVRGASEARSTRGDMRAGGKSGGRQEMEKEGAAEGGAEGRARGMRKD